MNQSNRDMLELFRLVRNLTRLALLAGVFLITALLIDRRIIQWPSEEIVEVVESDTSLYGQTDEETGMVIDVGYDLVKTTCSSCHSIKLVSQNRFSRQGWVDVIRWMQETQRLWDLGENEKPILDYLEKHLAPQKRGRRKPLENIKWHALE